MEAFIGLMGLSGMLIMAGAGLVAYRWNQARKYGNGLDSGGLSEWNAPRDGRDTQAGRI